MWWNKSPKGPQTLLEEHIQRVWDLSARLTALEDRMAASLEELSKRYRRAEQAERDRKKRDLKHGDQIDLEMDIVAPRHPAIVDLMKRRGPHAPDQSNSRTG